MGKLFNLKEWLTVADTTEHLSILFGETVTTADVLRLALDGRLKLSLNIVNPVPAKQGRIVLASQVEMTDELRYQQERLGSKFSESLIFEPTDNSILEIHGVFDFDLKPGHRVRDFLFLLHQYLTKAPLPRYRRLTSEQYFDRFELGIVAEADDGGLFQLQDRFEFGVLGKIYALLRHGMVVDSREPHFSPLTHLPRSDVQIVVRTQTLRAFEAGLNAPVSSDKPMATTERNTLLCIIAALCDYSAIKHQERGAAGQVAKLTEEIGAPITDDTIRKVLTKIPDALEARLK